MNAVNTLAREQAQADFEAAVAEANKWADVGRPIIMATIRMDGEVEDALAPLRTVSVGNYRKARDYVRDARRALAEMLDGIRSDFLADQMLPQPASIDDDDAWEACDQFSDALEAEVVSVRALIKQVEAEDYEAFLKGGRS